VSRVFRLEVIPNFGDAGVRAVSRSWLKRAPAGPKLYRVNGEAQRSDSRVPLLMVYAGPSRYSLGMVVVVFIPGG